MHIYIYIYAEVSPAAESPAAALKDDIVVRFTIMIILIMNMIMIIMMIISNTY